MAPESPLISVITATYNSEATVGTTLESVAAQDFRDLQHIVVDGASTDRTLEIVREHPSVELVSEPDRGIFDAFNKGLARAKGELINFLNSDDQFAHPGVLSIVAEAARRWPDVDVFHADMDLIDAAGSVVQEVRFFPEHPVDGPRNRENYAGLSYCPHIAHQTAFVRRRVFDQIGEFDASLRLAGDYDHFLRAYLAGVSFRYLPHLFVRMRNDGASNRSLLTTDLEAFDVARSHAGSWFVPSLQFARHQLVRKLEARSPQTLRALRFLKGSPTLAPWGPRMRRQAAGGLRLNFLVPSLHDTGGLRMTLEYAHRLKRRGHDVAIYAPRVYPDFGARGPLALLRRAKTSLLNTVREVRWTDVRVPLHHPLTLAEGLREADATIASAWPTAEALEQLPPSCGAKVYHVQDYEVFSGEKDRVDRTYRQDAHLIATSQYLVDTLKREVDRDAALCPLGMDTALFTPRTRGKVPAAPAPLRVLLLHHAQARKGMDRALQALALARAAGAPLRATAFGTRVPSSLDGVDATVRAPQREELVRLYTVHDVYLALPPREGWGLTVTEAMATGACVVCTRVGALDHVDPEGAATIVVDTPEQAAEALVALAADRARVAELGARAAEAAQVLAWDPAVEAFEAALRKAVAAG